MLRERVSKSWIPKSQTRGTPFLPSRARVQNPSSGKLKTRHHRLAHQSMALEVEVSEATLQIERRLLHSTLQQCNVYRQEFNWLYTAPEGGGQLKTQQPSKAPSTSAQKRAISFGHRTKRSGHEKISKRHIHFMIIIIHLHKKHMDINCCTLSLICLWNMNYLGKRGLISNRALTWNV